MRWSKLKELWQDPKIWDAYFSLYSLFSSLSFPVHCLLFFDPSFRFSFCSPPSWLFDIVTNSWGLVGYVQIHDLAVSPIQYFHVRAHLKVRGTQIFVFQGKPTDLMKDLRTATNLEEFSRNIQPLERLWLWGGRDGEGRGFLIWTHSDLKAIKMWGSK